MKKITEKYRKDQYAYWIFAIFLIISFFLFFKYDNSVLVYPIVILTIVAIIFHKLTILINSEEIVAYFGFGFFKRKIKISEIDFSSIELVKISWYTGVGIRYTSNGWLYNVKLGEAIKIVSKDKTKTFFVGTSEFNIIKQIISDEINNIK
jgi:hypothetical protein